MGVPAIDPSRTTPVLLRNSRGRVPTFAMALEVNLAERLDAGYADDVLRPVP